MCPKADLLQRVLYLISHRVPPSTSLDCVTTHAGQWENITPNMISKTLKTAVGFCGPNLGFEYKDISTRSLYDSVAIVLLCSGLDSNIINLIGRLHSNEILRTSTCRQIHS